MSAESLKCCYCGRDVKEIQSAMEGGILPPSYHSRLDLLYLDGTNHLACGRCISEHDISLKLGGEPVYAVYPLQNKVAVNKAAINKAVKEFVDLDEKIKPSLFH